MANPATRNDPPGFPDGGNDTTGVGVGSGVAVGTGTGVPVGVGVGGGTGLAVAVGGTVAVGTGVAGIAVGVGAGSIVGERAEVESDDEAALEQAVNSSAKTRTTSILALS